MTADLQVPSLSMSGAIMLFPYAVYSTFSGNFNFKTEAVNNIKFIFSFSGSFRLVALYVVAGVVQKSMLPLSGRMKKQFSFEMLKSTYQNTWCHNSENQHTNLRCCLNLISKNITHFPRVLAAS
jgi:hypothetical protein